MNVYSGNREQVPERQTGQTTQAKGIYPGATDVRGPDWAEKCKDQDGKLRTCFQTSSVTYNADDDG